MDFHSCEDSIKMMQAYCDVIVLRHPKPGSAKVSILCYVAFVLVACET